MGLFNDQSGAVVPLSVVRARLESAARYEAMTAELLSYYDGVHLPYLQAILQERIGEADVMAQVMEAANIVRPLTDLLSPAYTPPPRRELTGATEQQRAAFNRFLEDVRWDEAFDEANRLATLCGVVAVKLGVTSQSRRWTLEVLPPHCWWAVADPEAPETITAFVYEVADHTDPRNLRTRTFGVTATDVFWRDSSGPLYNRADVFDPAAPVFDTVTAAPRGRMPNHYGRLPVVLVYNRRPRGAIKPPADETLLTRQQSLNLKITGRNHNLLELAFSQLVLYGHWDRSFRRSVTEPIKVPIDRGGGEVNRAEYLTPDPFTAIHHEAIENAWELAAREHGLDPDSLRGRRTSTSGYHQELKDQRLRDLKMKQTARRARDEREAFALLKAIAAAEPDMGLTLPPDSALSVTFHRYRVPRDDHEEWQLLTSQVDRGIRPIDDLVRFVRPDLEGEEAVAAYLANVRARGAHFPLPKGEGQGEGS